MPAGGEERIEGLTLDVWGHSTSIVGKDKFDVRASGCAHFDIDDTCPRRESMRHRIESKVGENLPEWPGVTVHRKIRLALKLDCDVAVPQVALKM
jgi:hypothetical protein